MAVWLASTTPATAQVQLAISDGRVSLTATNATLRQILAEWARVGQTRIVNGDRVGGEPLTLQLADVPEERALAILLRSLSGYLAAPRPTPVAGASRFDRILVMPTVSRPRLAVSAPPAATQPAPEPMTLAPPDVEFEDPDAERPVRIVPAPSQRGSVFSAFPPPQYAPQQGTPAAAAPSAQPANSARPAVPAGVAVPGMIAPAPPESSDQAPPSRPPD
jgi:hypothetical protein